MIDLSGTIRKAALTDCSTIERCAHAAYEKYVERVGKRPAPMVADFGAQIENGHVYVVESGTAIVGYVVFYPSGDHIHLENVAVNPEHAGKGIGGRLIDFVEERAKATGYSAVELYTNAKMTENLAMYPKLGYIEIGRKNEDGFDRVFFKKVV